ncbi:hypothetical protein C5C41_16235 [Rathayibacter sp. AY1E9]|uniref:hypothetical protein n=1 Tax=unclassified Rathayibacter TaxID=2609250 RepID=UPI000CE83A40|nr:MULTISPECIES: hypothetical protein [unclassified Rathayibacter]PPG48988.1 hypothetical protein C5C41_16235 [Rathayibacter sp. AY1E9]PPH36820.1 hypothetical protein C5C86_15710 [Rathayibacter sp. AY1E4]
MHISQKTVGLLIDYVSTATSQATLGGVLKRHGLGDADPGPDDRPFSSMSRAKRADKALGAASKAGKEDELIDLATFALRDQEDDATAPEWARELLGSLRADGFACTATRVEVPATSIWAEDSRTEIRWAITSLGYTGLPVAALASDLADQLSTKGFATAAGHYDQALNAFHAQDWAASNGQLRTTFESVLLELATRRAGVSASGGGPAIDALQKNGDLPYGPNEYLRGLWKLSHVGGAHPGLSDQEDAHHRIYAVSAIVGWLVRTYA